MRSMRRHQHSGILYLSPVPEHSGTRLCPLTPVPDRFQYQNFCSIRDWTDWMPDSPTFKNAVVGGGDRDTHVQTAGSGK